MTKKINLKAKCASFDIEIQAKINTKGLCADEIEQVQKNLKHRLSDSVSKLPFSHIYPYEVSLK